VPALVFLRTGRLNPDHLPSLFGNALAHARYAIHGFPNSAYSAFLALGVFLWRFNRFK